MQLIFAPVGAGRKGLEPGRRDKHEDGLGAEWPTGLVIRCGTDGEEERELSDEAGVDNVKMSLLDLWRKTGMNDKFGLALWNQLVNTDIVHLVSPTRIFPMPCNVVIVE